MFGINTYSVTWIILILYIVKEQNVDSLPSHTYRCKNAKYITDGWFCDGANQCGDGSEEAAGCSRNRCGNMKFFCDNTCKNITVRCNTKPDCTDGTDELNCGNETNLNDCSWKNDKYLCDDNLRCLDFDLTCNGLCNCFDCSDEKESCLNDKEMEAYTKKASSYTCFKTPNGPHCCSEFDSVCHECSQANLNLCEHKCIEFRQEPRCLCDENYIGVAVGNTINAKCLSNDSLANILIYATENSIGILDIYTNKSHTIKDGISATSLTSARGDVYYATYANGMGRIFKILIASNDTREIISSESKIISLAIDWVANRTYYSTNASTIVACSEKGVCKKLKSSNAHSICLAPRFGLLFWVETKANQSNSQYIMKSSMDGFDETLLTVCEKISWPVAISIDELTETVYFWTRFMELSFITFDGRRKKMIQPAVFSPVDRAFFTTFEKKVYFASYESNLIHVGDITAKLFTAAVQMTSNDSAFVTHLYAYNAKLQRTKIANPCANSCPDKLCLLRPSSTRKALNHTCFQDTFLIPNSKDNDEHESVISQVLEKGHSNMNDRFPISEHEGNTATGIILLFVGIFIGSLISIAALFFIRDKRRLFINHRQPELNVPLQPRINNELSKEVVECSNSKFCETEYKKNKNCDVDSLKSAECSKSCETEYKKNNLDLSDCSKSDFNDFNYIG